MPDSPSPRVLAVLVAHDGEPWLPEVLDALAGQTYDAIDVIAVDNGSKDGSRRLLIDALGEDGVLVAERDLGFPAAASMALDAVPPGAPFVLFLHDDAVLDATCVEMLVEAMLADDRVAVVGPKLRDYDDPRLLQSVGLTIDLTGRMETGLDPDERDQGQRDGANRPVLFVSTAAVLVRREVFDRLGRFDRRYHAFRDDLDLCWRVWLAGYDVEIVTTTSARHVAGASNFIRMGQTAVIGPRYFAERNTLATLLKNYRLRRLLLLLPLYLLVGGAKVAGFVATRRLADAVQTVRAWVWNALHLPGTLRLRRLAAVHRERSDAELTKLFARPGPRVRAYAEAVGEWLAGGDLESEAVVDESPEPETATQRLIAWVRVRPVLVTMAVLGLGGLVASVPVLGPGSLRGGDFAPWAATSGAFLSGYGASWYDASGVGSPLAPSPAQALLGLLDLLVLGSEWLAPRLLLLGPPALAWLLALRAGATVTSRKVPRLAAATLYVLSPPAVAAALTGRLGSLVLLVGLPGFVVAARSAQRRWADPRGWRGVAAAALVGAVVVAFEPAAAVPLVLWALTAAGLALTSSDRSLGRLVAVRVLMVPVAAFLLLFPWSIRLVLADSPVVGGFTRAGADAEPVWRWLLSAPDLTGFPGPLAGVGLVLAALLGIIFGTRSRPAMVSWAVGVFLFGSVTAWILGRAGADAWTWPGAPLLLSAGASGALLLVAYTSAGRHLMEHDFGWRQLGALATGVAVGVGVTASALSVLTGDWDGFVVGSSPVPAFLATEADKEGEFRVVTVVDDDGVIGWDLTGPSGPSMASFGVDVPEVFIAGVGAALDEIVTGADPGAAGRLALHNIRYVVVPPGEGSPALSELLEDQLDLDPRPVAEGELYRVSTWLPRAVHLSRGDIPAVIERGEVPPEVTATALEPIGPAEYRGRVPGPGSVIVAEVAAEGWRASAGGRLTLEPLHGLVRFDVGRAGEVTVSHSGRVARRTLLAVQLAMMALTVSVLLRPPGRGSRQLLGPARQVGP